MVFGLAPSPAAAPVPTNSTTTNTPHEIPIFTEAFPWYKLGPQVVSLLKDTRTLQYMLKQCQEANLWKDPSAVLLPKSAANSLASIPTTVSYRGAQASLSPQQVAEIEQIGRTVGNVQDALSVWAYSSEISIPSADLLRQTRMEPLVTLRRIQQTRLEDNEEFLEATDPFIDDWFQYLLKYIQLNKAQWSQTSNQDQFLPAQVAVEALFYMASQIQWTSAQIVPLLNLIQSWPVSSVSLVDNPVLSTNQTTANSMQWESSSASSSHFKSPLEWENDWVSHVSTTSCRYTSYGMATLVLTVFTALDGTSEKYHNGQYAPNRLTEAKQLYECVRSPLDWPLPAIPAAIQGALGLLLPPTDPLRQSLLEAPQTHKAWTCWRTRLLPALLHANRDIDNSCCWPEFIAAVAVNHVHGFLEAVLIPKNSIALTSIGQWQEQEKTRISVARQMAQQEAQVQESMGLAVEKQVIPDLDLVRRPDCLDDILSFAMTVCQYNKAATWRFWKVEERTITDVSEILEKLEQRQADDDDLRASYYMWLATLALPSDHTARLIHQVLSSNEKSTKGRGPTWKTLLTLLVWFIGELKDDRSSTGSSSYSSRTSSSTITSTQYYYDRPDDINLSTTSTSGRSSATNTASSSSAGLPAENIYFLHAILSCITNVCQSWAEARRDIMSIQVPVDGTSKTSMWILFELAKTAVSSQTRGLVFSSISSLLLVDPDAGEEERSFAYDMALKGWDMVEQRQILPIYLLDQYDSGSANETLSRQPCDGMAFPPSLTPSKNPRTWVESSQAYGILYEMEWIESGRGIYPATIGFLDLLNTLFAVGGSPPNLGSEWRRPGCSPYMEYICHLVLPRLTGTFKGYGTLPFRTPHDRSRLAAACLKVVKTVLSCYLVPMSAVNSAKSFSVDKELKRLQDHARSVLRHYGVADSVVSCPVKADAQNVLQDSIAPVPGSMQPLDHVDHSYRSSTWTPKTATTASTLPPLPSPAFLMLVETLSGGELLQSLVSILTKSASAKEFEETSSKLAVAYSLFGAVVPDFDLYYMADKRHTSVSLEDLLVPLYPLDYLSDAEDSRDEMVLAALECLCAAAVREQHVLRVADNTKLVAKLTPVLGFSSNPGRLRQTFMGDNDIISCAGILSGLSCRNELICSLVEEIGYSSSNSEMESVLSATAAAILLYLDRSVKKNLRNGAADIFYSDSNMQDLLSNSIARRLKKTYYCRNPYEKETFGFLLKELLVDLRGKDHPVRSLVHGALGIQKTLGGGNRAAFDALLYILRDTSFVVGCGGAELAADCFEIVYRTSVQLRMDVAGSLPEGFWFNHLVQLVEASDRFENVAVFHSISWILKAISYDILCTSSSGLGSFESANNLLISLLSQHGGVQKLLSILPLEPVRIESDAVPISPDLVGKTKYEIRGAPEVVKSYNLVETDRLVENIKDPTNEDEEKVRRWCLAWNEDISCDCASAHLTDALQGLLGASPISLSRSTHEYDMSGTLTALLNILSGIHRTGLPSDGKIDDFVYTTASRNLALAVLETVQLGTQSSVAFGHNLPQFAVALAKCIALSGFTKIISPVHRRRNDRTSILSVSLALVIEKLGDSNYYSQHVLEFAEAGRVLAALATSNPNEDSDTSCARTCLASMLRHFHPTESCPASFVYQVFNSLDSGSTKSLLSTLMNAIDTNDDGNMFLLHSVAIAPHGADLLEERGILDLVERVARRSRIEGIPPHLGSHLTLLAGINFSLVGSTKQARVAQRTDGILRIYEGALYQLTENFPKEGEVLETYLKLFLHSSNLTGHSHSNAFSASLTYSGESIAIDGVLRFALHIAEHPLPDQWLVALPVFLSTETDGRDSWWTGIKFDGIKFQSEASKMSYYGTRAVKMACSALQLARSIEVSDTTMYFLCRGLVQSTCILKKTEHVAEMAPFNVAMGHLAESLLLKISAFVKFEKDAMTPSMSKLIRGTLEFARPELITKHGKEKSPDNIGDMSAFLFRATAS